MHSHNLVLWIVSIKPASSLILLLIFLLCIIRFWPSDSGILGLNTAVKKTTTEKRPPTPFPLTCLHPVNQEEEKSHFEMTIKKGIQAQLIGCVACVVRMCAQHVKHLAPAWAALNQGPHGYQEEALVGSPLVMVLKSPANQCYWSCWPGLGYPGVDGTQSCVVVSVGSYTFKKIYICKGYCIKRRSLSGK